MSNIDFLFSVQTFHNVLCAYIDSHCYFVDSRALTPLVVTYTPRTVLSQKPVIHSAVRKHEIFFICRCRQSSFLFLMYTGYFQELNAQSHSEAIRCICDLQTFILKTVIDRKLGLG